MRKRDQQTRPVPFQQQQFFMDGGQETYHISLEAPFRSVPEKDRPGFARIRGGRHQLGRGAAHQEFSPVHDGHPVAEGFGLLHVMGGVEDRGLPAFEILQLCRG